MLLLPQYYHNYCCNNVYFSFFNFNWVTNATYSSVLLLYITIELLYSYETSTNYVTATRYASTVSTGYVHSVPVNQICIAKSNAVYGRVLVGTDQTQCEMISKLLQSNNIRRSTDRYVVC